MNLWTETFSAPSFPWSEVARRCPDRGLMVVDKDLMAWQVQTGELAPVVHRPHGVVLFAINRMIDPLGRWIYFLDDQGGNEIGHISRIPFLGGNPQDLTPEKEPYTVVGLDASEDGEKLAINLVTSDGFELVIIQLSSNLSTRIYQSEKEFIHSKLSFDGRLVAVKSTEWTGNRHYGLKVFDTSSGECVAELWDDSNSNFWLSRFNSCGNDLLCSGLRDGRRAPLIWDPLSGERRWLKVERLGREVTPLDWTVDGRTVLLSSFENGVQTLHRYNLAEDTSVPVNHAPGAFGEYGGTYSRFAYFQEGETVLAHRQTSTLPLCLERYESDQHPVVVMGECPPPARPWTNLTFDSADGTAVQAWLGLPEGSGPFPTIISIHGGPHLVQTEHFCPFSQAWMEHGFAFLSLNYRGSTTFGCRFQEQIWGRLGVLECQDIVSARSYLVDQGIARSDAVFLAGESYGAFLTLLGLGRHPDLWAGGMATVALTDWTETYRDASAALQGAFRNWFGGSPEEVPDRYRESSPIHLVDKFQAPVMLFQGKNDSRTPPRQARLFEEKMRQAGRDIEVHWFDGGHALDSERKVQLQESMLSFVRRVLDR